MNQLFLFILILTNALLVALKYWRLALIVSISNIFIFLMIALGFIPNLLLNGLQTHQHLDNPVWEKNNVIILLGGGAVRWPSLELINSQNSPHINSSVTAYSRMFEAVRLYKDCKVKAKFCRILLTGGDPGGNAISEAEVMQKELIAIGINNLDILTEANSNNTLENAQFSSQLVNKENFDYVVLVTSGTHMRRALKAFAQYDITAVPAPADHVPIKASWKYLYQNFYITDIALHEYFGYFKNR